MFSNHLTSTTLLPPHEAKRVDNLKHCYHIAWVIEKTLMPLSTIWQWPVWLAHKTTKSISDECYRLLSGASASIPVWLSRARKMVFYELWHAISSHYWSFWWSIGLELLGEKMCLLDVISSRVSHINQSEVDRILAQELQMPLQDYISLKAIFYSMDLETQFSFEGEILTHHGWYTLIFWNTYNWLALPKWVTLTMENGDSLEWRRVGISIPETLLRDYANIPLSGNNKWFECRILNCMPHPFIYKKKTIGKILPPTNHSWNWLKIA